MDFYHTINIEFYTKRELTIISRTLSQALIALAQQIPLLKIPAHLKREFKMSVASNQCWVRPKARQAVLNNIHAQQSGHLGYYWFRGAVSARYWWPLIRRDVMEILDKRQTCHRFSIDKARWQVLPIQVTFRF